MIRIFIFAIFLLVVFPAKAMAGELTGFAAIDTRVFFSDTQLDEQRISNGASIIIQPEYYHISDGGKQIFTIEAFLRWDPYDGKRRHADLRHADWLYSADTWEFKAGISKEFWGVMETNHLVDIINQTDAVEDTDGEDKFGQPMLQFSYLQDWGTLRFYYLPYFRERSFAGINGRLRGLTPVESDKARYDSSAKQWNPDFAIRYEHTMNDWDIGIAHFSGTSREAFFVADINTDGQNIFIPFYDLIDQTSIDIQLTKEAWLWKLEALSRSGQGDRFYAASIGLEYSFYDIGEISADIGLLAEYHRDDRDTQAPITLLDDDVFFGTRLTLNDVDDTTFLGGVMVDRNSKTRFYSVEATTRLNDRWRIEFDMRIFSHINSSQIESGFNKDDYIQFRLARYF